VTMSANPCSLHIVAFSHFHTGSHHQHLAQYSSYSRHFIQTFCIEKETVAETAQEASPNDSLHKVEPDTSFWKQKLLFGTFMRHGEVHRSVGQHQHNKPVHSGISSPFHFSCSSQIPNLILATSMCNLSMIKNAILHLNQSNLTTLPELDRACFAQKLLSMKYVVYMHESQWLYPKKPALGFDGDGPFRRNAQEVKLLAYIQFESLMTADCICWNSAFHMNTFLESFGKDYIRNFRMEKSDEENIMKQIVQKSQVLHVGIELRNRFGEASDIREQHIKNMHDRERPIILWNMRWEYDKNPIQFVEALKYLRFQKKVEFSLVVCGGHSFQSREVQKRWFHDQLAPFKDDLLHVGYADSDTYTRLLIHADIVVSTAIHEFFGISVMEAIYCHTFCILPDDLSYPELIPQNFHLQCLYKKKGKRGLNHLLANAVTSWKDLPYDELRNQSKVDNFDWDKKMAHEYDKILQQIAGVEDSGKKRKYDENDAVEDG